MQTQLPKAPTTNELLGVLSSLVIRILQYRSIASLGLTGRGVYGLGWGDFLTQPTMVGKKKNSTQSNPSHKSNPT